jgi:hypothetical protein
VPDEREISGVGSLSRRLPLDAPLVLEASAVPGEQLAVLTAGYQLTKRSLAEVVDEHVVGAHDPIASFTRPPAVVVVLEHADNETFVKRSQPRTGVTSERKTEHIQHRHSEARPRVRRCPFGGECLELRVCGV